MSAVRQFRAEGERLKVPSPPAPTAVFTGVWRARGAPTSSTGIKEDRPQCPPQYEGAKARSHKTAGGGDPSLQWPHNAPPGPLQYSA